LLIPSISSSLPGLTATVAMLMRAIVSSDIFIFLRDDLRKMMLIALIPNDLPLARRGRLGSGQYAHNQARRGRQQAGMQASHSQWPTPLFNRY